LAGSSSPESLESESGLLLSGTLPCDSSDGLLPLVLDAVSLGVPVWL